MSWLVDAVLLRLYIPEDERLSGRPLYQVLPERMRERRFRHLALMRAPRGPAATRRHGELTQLTLRPYQDLPLILECVDSRESLSAFLAEIAPFTRRGLATLQDVRAWSYGEGISDGTAWPDKSF